MQLATRQVHLDFHNPREVQGIGTDFNGEEFADIMVRAGVDSVTVFAKCAHGFSYFPTEVGTIHPGLDFDLLGAQIDALHARGLRAPIYLCVCWDSLAAEQHPDWTVVDREGSVVGPRPLDTVSPSGEAIPWAAVDLASGYADYMAALVEELCQRYDTDGFFFDIVWPEPNYTWQSQQRMRESGIDLGDSDAVFAYAQRVMLAFLDRLSTIIRHHSPDATIFYNGTVDTDVPLTLGHQTHLELESLPTGGEAYYPYYPYLARYARSFGLPILGMTARFHSAWGDFGGIKTIEQMTYECGTILSAGGAISIGDQLQPNGRLEPAVYRMLGEVFGRVGDLGPWRVDARPSAEVAIVAAGETRRFGPRDMRVLTEDVQGAAQVLLELGVQFDIVEDDLTDLASYRALILPHDYRPDGPSVERLEAFRRGGGKLILTGLGGTISGTTELPFAGAPVEIVGPIGTVPCYMRLDDTGLAGGEVASDYDYVFYDQGYVVRPTGEAALFGGVREALFNRTWEHWISHAQAPVATGEGSPLAIMSSDILYLAVPLFTAYLHHDYWVYREILRHALDAFLPERLIRWGGPGFVEVSHHRQDATVDRPARQVVHLVSYHPRRSIQRIPHVDDAVNLADVSLEVYDPERWISRAYLAPSGTELATEHLADGYVRVVVPAMPTYTVLVLD